MEMYARKRRIPPENPPSNTGLLNFAESEKEEVLQKYGFTPRPPKQYRVIFEKYEAVLSDQKLRELQNEHPEWLIQVVEEVK